MWLVNLRRIFGSDLMTVEDRATLCVLVLLFRLCGCKVPPVCGLDVLDPLFRVNPFVLDQYIDVWTRGPSDSIRSFVVEVTSIAYRTTMLSKDIVSAGLFSEAQPHTGEKL